MTINRHLSLHLPDFFRRLGPVYGWCTFAFKRIMESSSPSASTRTISSVSRTIPASDTFIDGAGELEGHLHANAPQKRQSSCKEDRPSGKRRRRGGRHFAYSSYGIQPKNFHAIQRDIEGRFACGWDGRKGGQSRLLDGWPGRVFLARRYLRGLMEVHPSMLPGRSRPFSATDIARRYPEEKL